MVDMFLHKDFGYGGDDLRNGRILSMINKDWICFECSIKETKRKVMESVTSENGEICRGNWN